jgi:hypothetical protein
MVPTGTIFYLLLWFQALRDHDYYYIEILVPLLLGWIVIARRISKSHNRYTRKVSYILLFLLTVAVVDCKSSISERFEGWMNEWYNKNLKALYDLSPRLETLGIPKDAKIISIPDPSINASLYILDRKGFSDFDSDFNMPGMMADRISKGAGFLVINDMAGTRNELLKPYLEYKIYRSGNVAIYDLRPYSMSPSK